MTALTSGRSALCGTLALSALAAAQLSWTALSVLLAGIGTGWFVALITNLGMREHLLEAVAHTPTRAAMALNHWFHRRIWSAGLGLLAVGVAVALLDLSLPVARATFLSAAALVVHGLVAFLRPLYRGLARPDLDAGLTSEYRAMTAAFLLVVLLWHPSPSWLAAALLIPATATLVRSALLASELAWVAAIGGDRDRHGEDRPIRGNLTGLDPAATHLTSSACACR